MISLRHNNTVARRTDEAVRRGLKLGFLNGLAQVWPVLVRPVQRRTL
jgi:hypothetical protein